MAKEMTEKQKAALEAVPESKKGMVEKAYKGTASPRQAIKAKCYECVGYEDMSRGVRECSSQTCPVWAYRPGAGGKAREGDFPETVKADWSVRGRSGRHLFDGAGSLSEAFLRSRRRF